MEPSDRADGVQTHRPHPEEAHRSRVYPRSAHQVRKSAGADLRCAVSKDGRWLGLTCGRPSRLAQSFEARAPSGARAPQDDVRAPEDEVDWCVDRFEPRKRNTSLHLARSAPFRTAADTQTPSDRANDKARRGNPAGLEPLLKAHS